MFYYLLRETAPENCVRICSKGFLQTLASTLSLPLCGMPITTHSTPSSVDLSITWVDQDNVQGTSTRSFRTCFMHGISISTPSSPNLFSAVHFLARKLSKPMARLILAKSRRFSTFSSSRAPGVSRRSLINRFSVILITHTVHYESHSKWISIYSTFQGRMPVWWHYISLSL